VKRFIPMLALVGVLGLVAAACGDSGGGASVETNSGSANQGEAVAGGTLRFAQLSDFYSALDPQKEYSSVTWEYYRCCLLRTLLSYTGKTAAEGGNELQPDIASALPEVSADGLTWTFKLKQGIMYGDPFGDVEVTAPDIIRSVARVADPNASVGGYPDYYKVIDGFSDVQDGKADTPSGMEAPDPYTLVIHLTEPAGDLGYRFAMGATAPIPPMGDAVLGAADGHTRDYGRFLVATGPYQIEGSADLDFSQPVKDQTPVSGYEPGKSLVLERNPQYDPGTDGLRPAYADRIEVSIGGDNNDLYNKIEAGELDFVVDGIVPRDVLKSYATTPEKQDRLHVNNSDGTRYLAFNLAQPPFDDINVRKAVNYALNKEGMRTLRGGELLGDIAGHIFLNSFFPNNDLADYDPYATPNSAGDVNLAKEAMKQSPYDSDGDGICDAPECDNVLAITDEADPYPDQAALIQENLDAIGISLDVKPFERGTMYAKCSDPSTHMGICLAPAWGKDYPDPYTFGVPLFSSTFLFPSYGNLSLVGADADYLKKYDYSVTSVPSVDDKIGECSAAADEARTTCWADLDRQLMEEVVPWVPYIFDNNIDVLSSRINGYSFDQFAGLAAYDQMAIAADQQAT
jgi:peptide/nickel transport system substrate-binding protein